MESIMQFDTLISASVAAALATMLAGCGHPDSGGQIGQERTSRPDQPERSAMLHSCDSPFGTVALGELQASSDLDQYGLTSPVSLLRVWATDSHCFMVVERGAALAQVRQEHDLAEQGLLQQSGEISAARLVAADYVLTPFMTFTQDDSGGFGASIGRFLPTELGAKLPQLDGDLAFREAQVMLALTDQRTGLQIAVAEGSAKAAGVMAGKLTFDELPGLGELRYSDTDEGKVVSAALLDAFNNLMERLDDLPTG
jgi:Curli production assembly/transport component CsgG